MNHIFNGYRWLCDGASIGALLVGKVRGCNVFDCWCWLCDGASIGAVSMAKPGGSMANDCLERKRDKLLPGWNNLHMLNAAGNLVRSLKGSHALAQDFHPGCIAKNHASRDGVSQKPIDREMAYRKNPCIARCRIAKTHASRDGESQNPMHREMVYRKNPMHREMVYRKNPCIARWRIDKTNASGDGASKKLLRRLMGLNRA